MGCSGAKQSSAGLVGVEVEGQVIVLVLSDHGDCSDACSVTKAFCHAPAYSTRLGSTSAKFAPASMCRIDIHAVALDKSV